MTDQPRVPVVGAAILRDGRVLAARRTTPPEAAGRWELPGGKVEPGETADSALVREVAEELGCTVVVTAWLPGAAAIGETHELRVATADLVDGEPEPTEHDLLRWLGADELDDVDWLEPDRPFLAALAAMLPAGRMQR
ncbi:(deoxy)nucleoside triphosphate pyrophosphohydrolase [Nocardioides sp. P5_C9_2]